MAQTRCAVSLRNSTDLTNSERSTMRGHCIVKGGSLMDATEIKMRNSRSIPALLKAARSKDDELARRAIEALGKVGTDSTLARLGQLRGTRRGYARASPLRAASWRIVTG